MPRRKRGDVGRVEFKGDFTPGVPTRAIKKERLRKILNTPLHLSENVPPTKRHEAIRKDQDRKWAAAYELYDIPVNAPTDAKNVMLASCLMAELFAGCRAIPKGGAPAVPGQTLEKLLKAWHAFAVPGESKKARAGRFLKDSNFIKLWKGQRPIKTPASLLKRILRTEKDGT